MAKRKLTVNRLKKIISEEKKKIKDASTAETVSDAWAGGKNLVNQIDFIKKLGIKEARLRERANRISRARNALKKQILKDI
jgi:hypothetical protein